MKARTVQTNLEQLNIPVTALAGSKHPYEDYLTGAKVFWKRKSESSEIVDTTQSEENSLRQELFSKISNYLVNKDEQRKTKD